MLDVIIFDIKHINQNTAMNYKVAIQLMMIFIIILASFSSLNETSGSATASKIAPNS
jgi:hypothetical protein